MANNIVDLLRPYQDNTTYKNINEVIEKYKKNFDDKGSFQCGSGWVPLVKELTIIINKYNNFPLIEHPVFIDQIKEKFGTLRFSISSYHEEAIVSSIQFAESISKYICEECGDKGEIRNSGWVKTLCDTCNAMRHF